jgi:hypothetical protein
MNRFLKKSANPLFERLLFAFVCLTFSACMASYGRHMRVSRVTQTFKSGTVLEEHKYYYYNWIGSPDGIVGIRKDYKLLSKLWYEIDTDKTSLRVLVDRMMSRDPTNFYGAELKDPAGNLMGVLFTDSRGITIKMAGEKEIAYIKLQPIVNWQDDDRPWFP